MVEEREGLHFEYNEKAKKYLQPEERRHAGILDSLVMTYAPLSIMHQRDLSDTQYLILQKQ